MAGCYAVTGCPCPPSAECERLRPRTPTGERKGAFVPQAKRASSRKRSTAKRKGSTRKASSRKASARKGSTRKRASRTASPASARREAERAIRRFEKSLDGAQSALRLLGKDLGKTGKEVYK